MLFSLFWDCFVLIIPLFTETNQQTNKWKLSSITGSPCVYLENLSIVIRRYHSFQKFLQGASHIPFKSIPSHRVVCSHLNRVVLWSHWMTRLLASRHLLLLDLSKENEAMITGRSRMGDGGGGWIKGGGGPSQVEAQTFFWGGVFWVRFSVHVGLGLVLVLGAGLGLVFWVHFGLGFKRQVLAWAQYPTWSGWGDHGRWGGGEGRGRRSQLFLWIKRNSQSTPKGDSPNAASALFAACFTLGTSHLLKYSSSSMVSLACNTVRASQPASRTRSSDSSSASVLNLMAWESVKKNLD